MSRLQKPNDLPIRPAPETSATATINGGGDQEENTEGGKRSRDPELLAIERVVRLLEELDEESRARAVGYLVCRFNQNRWTVANQQ